MGLARYRFGTVVILLFSTLVYDGRAQSNIAFVDFQRAILSTAEVQQAQKQLEQRFSGQQQEITKLQEEIIDLQEKLQKEAAELTPQAQADLNYELQRKQRELQRKQEDLQEEIEQARQEILARVQNRMVEVVRKLATEKNLDAVLDMATSIYVKSTLDLTQEAINAYNQAYPAGSTAQTSPPATQ